MLEGPPDADALSAYLMLCAAQRQCLKAGVSLLQHPEPQVTETLATIDGFMSAQGLLVETARDRARAIASFNFFLRQAGPAYPDRPAVNLAKRRDAARTPPRKDSVACPREERET